MLFCWSLGFAIVCTLFLYAGWMALQQRMFETDDQKKDRKRAQRLKNVEVINNFTGVVEKWQQADSQMLTGFAHRLTEV